MPAFTKDDLVDMMDLLDSDGDGTVSKQEFKCMFTRAFPMSDAAFDQEWKKIDRDGDGNMSLSELCTYYGVSVSSVEAGVEERKNMTDDAVLELLSLQAAVYEESLRKEQAVAEKKLRQANVRNAATGIRAGVALVSLDDPNVPSGLETERRVMEYCALGDFKRLEACLAGTEEEGAGDGEAGKPAKAAVPKAALNLRIEDERGEMPLHKLARKGALSPLLKLLEHMDQNELKFDVNAMDRAGHSPLFHATVPQRMLVGWKRDKDFRVIATLLNRGADPKAQSNTGAQWSVLHFCAQNDALESVEEIFRFVENVKRMRAAELAAFVNLRDRDGRTALHIAAFRADEDLVRLLIAKGADVHAVEKAGHTPSVLAGKAGNGPNRAVLERHANATRRAARFSVEQTPTTESSLDSLPNSPSHSPSLASLK